MDASNADFPAAHSMDTTWYAVDADGVVAVFDSGEAGAVPNAAAVSMSPGDSTFDSFPLDAVRIARLAAHGALDDSPQAVHGGPGRAIVVLAAPTPNDEGLEGYRGASTVEARVAEVLAPFAPWAARQAGPRVLATDKPLSPEDVKRIAALAGVARVLVEHDLYEALERGRAGGDALFGFGNDDYDVPGAYVRTTTPEEPLRIDDLPEAVRGAVGAFRLPVRFAESPALHLGDHLRDEDAGIWGDFTLRGEPTAAAPRPSAVAPADASGGRELLMLVGVLLLVLFALWLARR